MFEATFEAKWRPDENFISKTTNAFEPAKKFQTDKYKILREFELCYIKNVFRAKSAETNFY